MAKRFAQTCARVFANFSLICPLLISLKAPHPHTQTVWHCYFSRSFFHFFFLCQSSLCLHCYSSPFCFFNNEQTELSVRCPFALSISFSDPKHFRYLSIHLVCSLFIYLLHNLWVDCERLICFFYFNETQTLFKLIYDKWLHKIGSTSVSSTKVIFRKDACVGKTVIFLAFTVIAMKCILFPNWFLMFSNTCHSNSSYWSVVVEVVLSKVNLALCIFQWKFIAKKLFFVQWEKWMLMCQATEAFILP